MAFNHDEMMFASLTEGNVAFLHKASQSADVAGPGWLVNWGLSESEFIIKAFFLLFSLEVSWWLSLKLTMLLMINLYISHNNFLVSLIML